MIGEPLFAGAVHDKKTSVLPTPAIGAEGEAGAPIGSAFTSTLATLVPAGFIALTLNL